MTSRLEPGVHRWVLLVPVVVVVVVVAFGLPDWAFALSVPLALLALLVGAAVERRDRKRRPAPDDQVTRPPAAHAGLGVTRPPEPDVQTPGDRGDVAVAAEHPHAFAVGKIWAALADRVPPDSVRDRVPVSDDVYQVALDTALMTCRARDIEDLSRVLGVRRAAAGSATRAPTPLAGPRDLDKRATELGDERAAELVALLTAEMEALSRLDPAGPAVLSAAVKDLAAARSRGDRSATADALGEVATAAIRWRERLMNADPTQRTDRQR